MLRDRAHGIALDDLVDAPGRCGVGAAWLSLDAGDDDPAVFWTYAIAAIQRAAPRDDGDGIAPDEGERIFERFYSGSRVGSATSATGRRGRGIGLTIARSLARAHGGDVVASSPGQGRGATFRMTVPELH